MEKTTIIVAVLVGYNLALIGIGLWASRRTGDEEAFFLGSRSLGPVVAAISYSASASSAWTLLGVSGAAYLLGVSVIWIAAGSISGMLVAWFWLGPRLMKHTRDRNEITLTAFVAGDSTLGMRRAIVYAASAVVIFSFTFYVAAQLQGAGTTFSSTFGFDMGSSIVLGAFIIVLYTLLGGFWAVSVTDVVQGGLMSLAALLLPIVAIDAVGGWSPFLAALEAASSPQQLSWTAGNTGLVAAGIILGGLSIGFGTYGQPHLLVRFMALRDEKSLRQARVLTILWYLVVFGGMCLLGLAGHVLQPGLDNSETILFSLTDNLFAPALGAILIAAVLSAIMSTADSQLLVVASSIVHDLRLGRRYPRYSMLISRLSIIAVGLLAVSVALLLPEKIFSRVLFAWTALGAAFGPTVFMRLAGRALPPRAVLSSLLTGFGLAVILYLLPDTPGDVVERLAPFCAAFAVLLWVSKPGFNPRPDPKTISQ